ncbi:MAG: hypothetical protein JSU67_09200 [Gammaproteobacteria bacterium]|nr:MAG: hypothetical protein JSU67_09200 [Gammaproteobacteria bacterium]
MQNLTETLGVKKVGLFSAAQKDSRVGVDFLPDGVAVVQVGIGKKHQIDLYQAASVKSRCGYRRRRLPACSRKKKPGWRLIEELAAVEEQLRVTTIGLIDTEKMFQLMNELIYREAKLKLISLKRREVRSAFPPAYPEQPEENAGIYRHVLELKFAGKNLDILKYMQSMEALDWKLL